MKKIFNVASLVLFLLIPGEKFARAARLNLDAYPSNCSDDWIDNGNFEQGNAFWSSDPDPRFPHALIVQFDQAYDGQYSALLGNDEGTRDSIRQQVTIPPGAILTYWWRMKTYETTIFHDVLEVNLLNDQGEIIQSLAAHPISGIQDTWLQNSIDLSSYAGSNVWLNFSVYNDNYYFSSFYLDSVCMIAGSHFYFPLILR